MAQSTVRRSKSDATLSWFPMGREGSIAHAGRRLQNLPPVDSRPSSKETSSTMSSRKPSNLSIRSTSRASTEPLSPKEILSPGLLSPTLRRATIQGRKSQTLEDVSWSRQVSAPPDLENSMLDPLSPLSPGSRRVSNAGRVGYDLLGRRALSKPNPIIESSVHSIDACACVALARKHHLEPSEVKYMYKVFAESAKNDRGGVAMPDFEVALKKIFSVPAIQQDVLKDAYKSSDMHDQVNMEKFVAWYVQNMFTQVTNMNATVESCYSNALVSALAKELEVKAIVIDKLKKQFDIFDTDKSGIIEFEEFQVMLMRLLHAKSISDITEVRVNRFWKEIDADGSGGVDFREFTRWYLKYFRIEDDSIGGPLESFYDSFNPERQRRSSIAAANLQAAN